MSDVFSLKPAIVLILVRRAIDDAVGSRGDEADAMAPAYAMTRSPFGRMSMPHIVEVRFECRSPVALNGA